MLDWLLELLFQNPFKISVCPVSTLNNKSLYQKSSLVLILSYMDWYSLLALSVVSTINVGRRNYIRSHASLLNAKWQQGQAQSEKGLKYSHPCLADQPTHTSVLSLLSIPIKTPTVGSLLRSEKWIPVARQRTTSQKVREGNTALQTCGAGFTAGNYTNRSLSDM